MLNKRFIALSLAFATTFTLSSAAPSSAETFVFSSGPLTNLNPAGATINGGFTKFPTGSGMYIQQCIAPVGTARPVTCSDTLQLWVSATGDPGSISSTGPIAMKVSGSIIGRGVTVDCTTSQCGLFFRRDRTATADTSEDKFLPISFAQGTTAPVLAADEVVVTLNGKVLVRNVPSNLGYRDYTKIVATTKSGLEVNFTSLTPDCTFNSGTFLALKGDGQCALAFSTVGNTTFAAAAGNFPFILIPGDQKIERMPKSLIKGKSKKLPMESNFGTVITYKSLTKNCIVDLNSVKSNKAKPCKIQATAAAKVGMWNALKVIFTIPSK